MSGLIRMMPAVRLRASLLDTPMIVAPAAVILGLGAGIAAVRYGPRAIVALLAIILVVAALKRVEIMFAALFLSAFIAPAFIGTRGASLLIVGATTFLLLRALAAGQPIVGAWFLVPYALVYLIAAAHGDGNASVINSLAKYLAYPAFAVAAASVLQTSALRQRVLTIMLLVMAAQAPFVISQALGGISLYGASNGGKFGDFVTGTLGSFGSGRIAQVGVLGATVLFALAIERIWKPKLLAAGAVLFLAFGVFSIARAVFFFTPVAFGAVVIASAVYARRSIRARRLIAVSFIFLLATPALALAMSTLYPGVNEEISSAAKIQDYLFNRTSGNAKERGGQITTAVSIATNDSFGRLLLGAGPGTTWVGSDPHLPLPEDNPFTLTNEQGTAGVWYGKVLVEAGVLGLLAFFGLLAATIDISRRTRHRTAPGSFDGALLVAMTGVAALALIASTYSSTLDEPSFAVPFWTMLGMTLAIAHSNSRQRQPLPGQPDADAEARPVEDATTAA
jgi:hypothetical protein